MTKFGRSWKIGDKVKVIGSKEICTITEIHETRLWVKLDIFLGSFQKYHLKKVYK